MESQTVVKSPVGQRVELVPLAPLVQGLTPTADHDMHVKLVEPHFIS